VEGNNVGDKDIQRFFVMRKEKDDNFNKQYYVCYAYVLENGVVSDPKMEVTMKLIGK
jgi:hypothetical protein